MDYIETLTQRNAEFSKTGFFPELKIIPSKRAMVIGCVDPRVDPMDVLGLEPGEAAIIRNVGGRVTPEILDTMEILRTVSKFGGEEMGQGWHFILLHHTKCGIKGCYHHAPNLLTKYMGVDNEGLAALQIDDPYKAVVVDVEALRKDSRIPSEFMVSALVYDVDTGLIETVIPPAPLRKD
jgi:carbonic anhydrase